jgi:hypothetical protein
MNIKSGLIAAFSIASACAAVFAGASYGFNMPFEINLGSGVAGFAAGGLISAPIFSSRVFTI